MLMKKMITLSSFVKMKNIRFNIYYAKNYESQKELLWFKNVFQNINVLYYLVSPLDIPVSNCLFRSSSCLNKCIVYVTLLHWLFLLGCWIFSMLQYFKYLHIRSRDSSTNTDCNIYVITYWGNWSKWTRSYIKFLYRLYKNGRFYM